MVVVPRPTPGRAGYLGQPGARVQVAHYGRVDHRRMLATGAWLSPAVDLVTARLSGMRISESNRVLFVHIEKTGGKTIDAMFDSEVPDSSKGRAWARHWGYTKILAEFPEWSDWWSFGFVRNPWDRMVSWWSMAVDMREKLATGDPEATALYEFNKQGWDPILQYADDFDAFVLRGTEEVPRLGRQQVAKLTDRASGRRVDFIGRQETFMADLNVVRKQLRLPPVEDVGRRNASKHAHYSNYYTPATRQRVAEAFSRDIDAFGYTFEVP